MTGIIKNIAERDGTIWMLPFRSDVRLLYYRKDLFAEKGIKPPETWEEEIEAARALTQPPLYGVGLHARQYNATSSVFYELFWSRGGKVLDENMKPMFNAKQGIRALETYIELLKYAPPDKFAMGAYEVATAFTQGRVAMAHNWPLLAGHAQDPENSKVIGKWDVVRMPHAPGYDSHTQLGGWALSINADSKHKEAAYKLIEWLTTAESEKKIILLGGEANCCRASTFTDPEVTKMYFHFPTMGKAFEVAMSTPLIPEWIEINDLIVLAMSEAATGLKTPGKALDDAATKGEKILREAGYYN